MTIIEQSTVIFWGNQAKDDSSEENFVMILPTIAKKEEISRVREHYRVIYFLITGHGYTDGMEVDSIFCAKRTAV
jgi:hypothetical protein